MRFPIWLDCSGKALKEYTIYGLLFTQNPRGVNPSLYIFEVHLHSHVGVLPGLLLIDHEFVTKNPQIVRSSVVVCLAAF